MNPILSEAPTSYEWALAYAIAMDAVKGEPLEQQEAVVEYFNERDPRQD